ncbi:MAG: SUMF1/EgtB/PvdO family nonheme iron enzyme [Bryobacteraceae bacterium]|nr:SUMF1/EgtB/PvdO family nonheme iron enzyme [Bryobacteraceae bacterium]
MIHDVHNSLEHLLRGLPEWEQERDRRALLSDILRGHSVWDYLRLDDSVAVSANTVIATCQDLDPESLCVLLKGLRERYKTDPERRAEIDSLASLLCSRSYRRRGAFRGEPYLGLTYFDRQDAPIFFGRETELQQLVDKLNKEQGRRFCVVLGASGSGKSSLVRAGLWARLAMGEVEEMPGSRNWLISAMTPTDGGGDPMAALRWSARNALLEHESFRRQCDWRKELSPVKDESISRLAGIVLAKASPDAQWLLILDQMEELFATTTSGGADFLDQLIQATGPPCRMRVVATLRADFYHHCGAHPPLVRMINGDGGAFHLGTPGRSSLERMVSGPLTEVELTGDEGHSTSRPKPWSLDPELPSLIASDAEREPGGLALMAFALRELYEACKASRRLDVATYRSASFGGLAGAIARKADDTLASLGAEGETALHRVFSRLVRVNPDDAPSRRRERLSVWAADEGALHTIEAFREARLLVADRGQADDPVVEVAHEALLREWPRLAQWIKSEKDALHLAERVRAQAKAWGRENWSTTRQRPFSPEYVDRIRQSLHSAGLLAGLLEDPVISRLLKPEVEWILEELKFQETDSDRRLQIGRRLAKIGDPRPGVGVREDGVPDILWREISAATVHVEERGSFLVEPFRIAAFPVTASQFRAFVQAADGYSSKLWWDGLQREDPHPDWERMLTNHPVTDVSWYDATAFAQWLAARLEMEVRLPDEQEWQLAAQSETIDFKYPWGKEWDEGHANTEESHLGGTTAVGVFPKGDSLQAVSDLAGNVWEWCRNLYADPAKIKGDSAGSRVLRGGSWLLNQGFARADDRDYYHPLNRFSNIGFRVVVSSPIGKR